jgi:hypothetical protein
MLVLLQRQWATEAWDSQAHWVRAAQRAVVVQLCW